MNETLEKIGELGIVPVVKIEKAEDALPLGKALIDGDLPIAEKPKMRFLWEKHLLMVISLLLRLPSELLLLKSQLNL